MGIGALAAVHARLNVLFGIVPSTTGIGHEHSYAKASSQAADEKPHHATNAQQQPNHKRHKQRQERWQNHLLLRCLRANSHRCRIVWHFSALHDARLLAELPTHLLHHPLGSPANRLHGECTKNKHTHGSDKEAHEHLWIHKRHVVKSHVVGHPRLLDSHNTVAFFQFFNGVCIGHVVDHATILKLFKTFNRLIVEDHPGGIFLRLCADLHGESTGQLHPLSFFEVAFFAFRIETLRRLTGDILRHNLAPAVKSDSHFLDVGCHQRQGRQCCGADCKSLAGGGRRVAQRIERVCTFAHHFVQPGHLSIATGVVGNRAVGIRRQRDAQRREHADCGNPHAVQAQGKVIRIIKIKTIGKAERQQRSGTCDQHRRPRAQHAFGNAADDDGRRASQCLVGQFLGRCIFIAR